jgi:hypothetical protein
MTQRLALMIALPSPVWIDRDFAIVTSAAEKVTRDDGTA